MKSSSDVSRRPRVPPLLYVACSHLPVPRGTVDGSDGRWQVHVWSDDTLMGSASMAAGGGARKQARQATLLLFLLQGTYEHVG